MKKDKDTKNNDEEKDKDGTGLSDIKPTQISRT